MTVVEKVDFLIKKLDLTEKEFSRKYRIRKNIIKKWRTGEAQPKPENVRYLCDKFGLSVEDFLDSDSSLDMHNHFANEHKVVSKMTSSKKKAAISEDYPHEDNSRYEEKD